MSEHEPVKDVFIVADNILSPIGRTTAENFGHLKEGISGVKIHHNPAISVTPFTASIFKDKEVLLADLTPSYTKFEQLLMASIQDALKGCSIDLSSPETICIICSTKGNISLLETEQRTRELNQRVALYTSAALVKDYFGLADQPVVISNACISGVLGIITGMRLLQRGQYRNAIVTGADAVSKFVVSGFQSFQALSLEVCRPFDKSRNGLNLGEGASTMVLSTQKQHTNDIRVTGGATSNDANHISGPSRTGQELGFAIGQAMKAAGITSEEINFISTHGTATVYNDEMEANAIGIAGVAQVPLFSLKGNYGHTLGAAGVIETVAALHCLKENILLPSLGFTRLGVTQQINVNTALTPAPLQHALKTASGFGGCNAALVLSK